MYTSVTTASPHCCSFDKSQVQVDRSELSLVDEAQALNAFEFELHYIKALPVSQEPTMILVSCASAGVKEVGRRVSLKRKGETALRLSGVGYTIVRPGQLLQEPGGYKALVFDQGNRISEVRNLTDSHVAVFTTWRLLSAWSDVHRTAQDFAPSGVWQPALATLLHHRSGTWSRSIGGPCRW
jgi:hypothetical protein